jgi:hypothetical protein
MKNSALTFCVPDVPQCTTLPTDRTENKNTSFE